MVGSLAAIRVKSRKPAAEYWITSSSVTRRRWSATPTIDRLVPTWTIAWASGESISRSVSMICAGGISAIAVALGLIYTLRSGTLAWYFLSAPTPASTRMSVRRRK